MASGTAYKALGYDSSGDPTEISAGELSYYDTTEYVINNTTRNFSITHDLGVVPKQVDMMMVCKTAEDGWAVGDEVFYGIVQQANFYYGTAGSPRLVWHTATTSSITIVGSITFGSFVSFGSVNKSTGATATLTVENWRIRFKVIA